MLQVVLPRLKTCLVAVTCQGVFGSKKRQINNKLGKNDAQETSHLHHPLTFRSPMPAISIFLKASTLRINNPKPGALVNEPLMFAKPPSRGSNEFNFYRSFGPHPGASLGRRTATLLFHPWHRSRRTGSADNHVGSRGWNPGIRGGAAGAKGVATDLGRRLSAQKMPLW